MEFSLSQEESKMMEQVWSHDCANTVKQVVALRWIRVLNKVKATYEAQSLQTLKIKYKERCGIFPRGNKKSVVAKLVQLEARHFEILRSVPYYHAWLRMVNTIKANLYSSLFSLVCAYCQIT